jgi:hypothetical protein
MLDIWTIIGPYVPYIAALIFIWIIFKIVGGHIHDLIKRIFDEVRSVLRGPTLKQMNFVGMILLFILIVLLIFESSVEFLFGGAVSPADHTLYEHALVAVCIFLFLLGFLISVALAK